MRAVVCHQHRLAVAEVPEPAPARGHVVLDVVRAGICGSDLHARTDSDTLAEVLTEVGYDDFQRAEDSVVLGHEFVGVVAEHGSGTRRRLPVGTPVVAIPLVRHGDRVHGIGLSRKAPGAYAERLLVQESLMLPVPDGLPLESAALTEPMAVGWHAVARGEVSRKDVAVVIGCGPVGLAVIASLAARGVRRIVASDPSAARRSLATRLGATVVVDPGVVSPFAGSTEAGHFTTLEGPFGAAVDALDGLTRLPLGWGPAWRALEATGVAVPKRPVVFECVGVPGMLDRLLADVPLYSRVVVVGVCMAPDRIRPSMAINKEIDLRFVLGYTPLEFRDTLHALTRGRLEVDPLITGTVGLDGVAAAFDELGSADRHAKVLIDPAATSTAGPPSRPR